MAERVRQLALDLPPREASDAVALASHPGAPARQLALDLLPRTSFAAEDFLVGSSNERAYGLLEGWPAWPSRLMRLVGPPGSGKSHLAAMWASRAEAGIVAASELRGEAVPDLACKPALVIEDIDRGPLEEAALFHLVNLGRERRSYLLLTSTLPPDGCGFSTADLISRLRLAPSIELGPPDDDLLKSVLVKLFLDRQLLVDAAVIDFLAARIERSLGAARRIVAELDREALSRGRRVTRPIAAHILSHMRDDAPVEDGG